MPEEGGTGVSFWALMGFTFVLMIAPQVIFPALAPLHLAFTAAAVAVAAHLWDWISSRRPLVRLRGEMGIATGLLAWAVLTIPYSLWPGGSLAFLSGVFLKTLVIFWLLGGVVRTATRLRQMFWGLTLMALPLSATATANFLSGSFVPGGGRQRIVGYEAPLTANPNDLALMLNLLLPLGAALLLDSRRPVVRGILLAFLILDGLAVVLTFSRGGFLTLAAIVMLYLWKRHRKPGRSWAWAALALGLMSLPFLPTGYLDRLGTIANLQSDSTGSAQARWGDAVAGARSLLEHPLLGAGVGMDVLALNRARGPTWKAAHNVYLQYGLDLGVPGLALFVWLLVRCVCGVRRVQRTLAPGPSGRSLSLLAEGIEVSLLAFAVAAFFHPAGYNFYFYYVAGLAVAAGKIGEAQLAAGGEAQAPGAELPAGDGR